MLKNYLKTAFRNFWRNKTFSAINILGLSIGVSAALVIFLIVHYEFSYDHFEKDGDRIYRVVLDAKFNGTEGHSAAVPAPLGGLLANKATGIEETVPVMQFQGDATAKVTVIRDGDKPVVLKKQPAIVFTNTQYFRLLHYEWVAGSQQIALKEPFAVVLTESRAQQYFPNMPAAAIMGRQISYNDMITATVSGIVKDLNRQTAFNCSEFISFPTIAETRLQHDFMMNVWDDWMAYSQLYIKLSKGNTAERTEAQLKRLLINNKDINKDTYKTIAFHLQPLHDIHFNNNYQGVGQRIAHLPTLYGLLAVAAFLLLLGCINFINLTTAYASHRAKEIGIRKIIGSSKKQLIVQFLSETLFITIIATLLSVALTPLLLKMFENFIPPGLRFNLIQQPAMILFLFLLTIVVSFLSGLYPALVLSGYKPVLVLKNQAFTSSAQTRSAWIRKTLTVSQFVIAQFFVIVTIMVSKQINYSLHADMGFNSEAVLTFDQPRDTVPTHTSQLLSEIKAIPGIAVSSTGFFAPADKGVAFTNIALNNGKEEVKPQQNVQIRWGDADYIKVYSIKLLAGRNVQQSDTIKEFLVNESYAHALGFQHPEDILNKYLQWNGKSVPIVGVMQDFHDQSMRSFISPVVFGGGKGSTFHIKLAPNNEDGSLWRNTIAAMQKAYKQMYPEEDFNYTFLDDKIAAFYEREKNTASLLQWAMGLSVFISCLGLLGLAMYTTSTRTKEIGIRKILGASVTGIVSILSKEFVWLVLIAFLLAAPLSWWATYNWLKDFAYRTDMSWWIFVVCGLAMIIVAFVTLSVQIIKAAIANPVKSLRTE